MSPRRSLSCPRADLRHFLNGGNSTEEVVDQAIHAYSPLLDVSQTGVWKLKQRDRIDCARVCRVINGTVGGFVPSGQGKLSIDRLSLVTMEEARSYGWCEPELFSPHTSAFPRALDRRLTVSGILNMRFMPHLDVDTFESVDSTLRDLFLDPLMAARVDDCGGTLYGDWNFLLQVPRDAIFMHAAAVYGGQVQVVEMLTPFIEILSDVLPAGLRAGEQNDAIAIVR